MNAGHRTWRTVSVRSARPHGPTAIRGASLAELSAVNFPARPGPHGAHRTDRKPVEVGERGGVVERSAWPGSRRARRRGGRGARRGGRARVGGGRRGRGGGRGRRGARRRGGGRGGRGGGRWPRAARRGRRRRPTTVRAGPGCATAGTRDTPPWSRPSRSSRQLGGGGPFRSGLGYAEQRPDGLAGVVGSSRPPFKGLFSNERCGEVATFFHSRGELRGFGSGGRVGRRGIGGVGERGCW